MFTPGDSLDLVSYSSYDVYKHSPSINWKALMVKKKNISLENICIYTNTSSCKMKLGWKKASSSFWHPFALQSFLLSS